jgi:hypothetical protein
MKASRHWTLVAALAAFCASPALADTLELKSGSLLRGTYLGGTQATVRFQVGETAQTLAVTDIVALTFEGRPAAQPVQGQATPAVAPATTQPAGQAQPIVVPAGTNLLVRMSEGIDSKKHKDGHRFTAVLEAPLAIGSRIVAPQGSTVYGRLASAQSAGRIAGSAELKIELTDIMINGLRQPLLTGTCKVKGESQGKNSARKVAGGAVIGGLIKGKKGAKKGAKVGVGAAVLTRGNQVSVPSGTLLEFSLRSPLHVQ